MASNPWEEALRKMLPEGAPLPDEDHLDYSISVDYYGPSPPVIPRETDLIPRRKFATFFPKHTLFTHYRSNTKIDSGSSQTTSSNKSLDILIACDDDDTTNAINDDEVDDHEVRECSKHDCNNFESFGERAEEIRSGFGVIVRTNEGIICGGKGGGVLRERVDDENEVGDHESGDCNENPCNDFLSFDEEKKEIKRGIEIILRKTKGTVCARCGEKGSRLLRQRVGCFVCGAEYCKNCALKAMGSLPEGRKCLGCIGKPIDEARRGSLGKCSRVLAKLCSSLEVKRIMKAERECTVNQVRPDHILVNGRQLTKEELVELLGCKVPPRDLRPGRYWYDRDSGLWGKAGEKPNRIISSKLNVGGKLLINASNGNTRVYINGREITKVELRVLKLAKVQCPRETHFWVYEDGSYEEEGQNKIRGNIWQKVSTRFICSLFSLPVPPESSRSTKSEPTTYSARSILHYLDQDRVQKLLLLGFEESGTSTIFKQVKIQYANKFTAEELQNIKLTIQSNVYRYLSILLAGREHFEEEALNAEESSGDGLEVSRQCIYSINQRIKHFSDWLLDITATGDLDAFFPAAAREYAPVVAEIWKDFAIQETYKRMKELHSLPDVAKYFLDRVIEISHNEYEPSEEEILFAEGVTPDNGLASVEFSFDDHSLQSEMQNEHFECQPPLTRFQLLCLSFKGLHGGCKWLEMFDDVRSVVFGVSLSDYDGVWICRDTGLLENKMLATRDLFENIVRHTSIWGKPFVLLLNKYDIFEDKIIDIPLTVCEWFHDFNPVKPGTGSHSRAHQAYYYIAMKFKELYASITGRKLYVSKTRTRKRASVDKALKYIKEILKWEEQKDGVIYATSEDDSFSSTGVSFSHNHSEF